MQDVAPRQTLTHQAMPTALKGTIVASVAMHALVVATLVLGTQGLGRVEHHNEAVIITKLVKLGKERPKELLPRKDEGSAPAAKPVAVAADKSNDGKVATGKDPAGEKRSLSDALSRLKKSSGEDPEGHPEGVVDGEVTSLAQAIAGSRYLTEIYRCVKANYSIEALPRERILGKSVPTVIHVQGDGTLFDIKIKTSSGVPAFDRAVEKAIKRCGKVSPPPADLANEVRTEGLLLEFRPD